MLLLVVYSKIITAGHTTEMGLILAIWKYSIEVQYKSSRMNGMRSEKSNKQLRNSNWHSALSALVRQKESVADRFKPKKVSHLELKEE
jgi:hypothetical protein